MEVLGSVEFIASENVRKTRNLLAHYGLKTPVRSYREENSRRAIPKILEALAGGGDVALVAEAGTPGVSDPGRDLVDAAHRGGYAVVPVPGPSAAVAAVSVAGMSESRFVFEGFLPRRRARRQKRLRELSSDERLLVFFEAPHRLSGCLSDMLEALGDRNCLVAREITKMYEEVSRGRLSDLAGRYSGTRPRGEFVIVCEGAREAPGPEGEADSGLLLEEGRELMRGGMKKSEAAKRLAAKHGVKRSEVYALLSREPRRDRDEV